VPTLAAHTSTPSACWLCLWDSYGWLHGSPSVTLMRNHGSIPSRRRSLPGAGGTPGPASGPGVSVVRRCVDASTPARLDRPRRLLGSPVTQPVLAQDHAWCVASEIDRCCTLVAGTAALAQALMGDRRPTAWRVHPTDPIALDSDHLNT
jgi:hypothetical protein